MTSRVGRFCHRHRWLVLLFWVVAVGAGVFATGPVFDKLSQQSLPDSMESFQAYNVLAEHSEYGATVAVLVDGVDVETPEIQTVVTETAADVGAMSGVLQVVDPYAVPGYLAEDGRALLLEVVLERMDEDSEEYDAAVTAVSDRLRELDDALPNAEVTVGGSALLNEQLNEAVSEDLSRSELMSLPVTLLVLVLVFGGVIAAGLPLMAAIATSAFSFLVLLGFSQFFSLDPTVTTVVTLLSLGLSIDYGLLLVARYREELAHGFSPEEAVSRAWATAGRTILFSGLTVAAALTGLLMFTDIPPLQAIGSAGIAATLAAMTASLTLTAALLRLARKRIKPSKRRLRRQHRYGDAAEIGFFASLARTVQRRPLITSLGVGALLLVAGFPLLRANLAFSGLEAFPTEIESVRVEATIGERFGRDAESAIMVVARTDAEQLQAWADGWRDTPGVTDITPAQQLADNLSRVQISVAGASHESTAQDLVERIRDNRPVEESWVAGSAAEIRDVIDAILNGLPGALTVTLLAMVVLLFLMTGSLVIPLKAILMNIVSLGATFGVMVAVFQDGWLSEELETVVTGALSPLTLVVMFAFAFGLSMDYEVFLLGRITELVRSGHDTDTAVRRGLQHSGWIITSAAAIMVIVFAGFASARISEIEQLGLGLAVAVFVDATVVRCLLVPATMTLLGRWNWWAPGPLKRFQARFGLREHEADPTPAFPYPAAPQERDPVSV